MSDNYEELANTPTNLGVDETTQEWREAERVASEGSSPVRCHAHGVHELSVRDAESLLRAFIDLANEGKDAPSHACPLTLIGK